MRQLTPGAAAAAFVVAVVAAVDPSGLAPFGPAKWLVVTAGIGAVAAMSFREGVTPARLPTSLLAAVAGLAAVAAAAGVDGLYAWVGTPERHWGVLTWMFVLVAFLAGHALDRRELPRVAAGAAAAGAICGAWAAAESLGWEPIALTGASGRPGGPFGSSAYLGAAAVLLGPVALGFAAGRVRSRPGTVATWASAGGAAFALLASGARAAWVGGGVATLAWAVVRRPRVPGRVMASVGVLLLAAVVATGAAGRARSVLDDDAGGIEGRLDEWRIGARAALAHPLLGVGPEGYRIDFADHVDAAYERRHGREPLPDRAHSAPLDVAVTAGLPAALAYVVLLLVVARRSLRVLRHGTALAAGVAAGVLGYFVHSLLLFPVAEVDLIAWLLVGSLFASTRAPSARRQPLVRAWASAVGAVVSVVALVVGGLDVAADRRARRALDDRGGDPSVAVAATELRPDAVRYRLVASRWFERAPGGARYGAAIAELDRALDVSPRDPVVHRERNRLLLDRARASRRRDDVEAAVDALRSASTADPLDAATLLRLGIALTLDDDDAAAIAAWRRAEALAPRSAAASTNLAVTFARQGRTAEARAAARRALAREPGATTARQVLDRLDGT